MGEAKARVLFVPEIQEIRNDVSVAPSTYEAGIYCLGFDTSKPDEVTRVDDSLVYISQPFLSSVNGIVINGVAGGWNWLSSDQRGQHSIAAVWLPPETPPTWAYAIPVGVYHADLQSKDEDTFYIIPIPHTGSILMPQIAYGIPIRATTRGWAKRRGGTYPVSGRRMGEASYSARIVNGQPLSEEAFLLNEIKSIFGENTQISVSGNVYSIRWTPEGATEEVITRIEYRDGVVSTISVGVCVSGADRLIPYAAIPTVVREHYHGDNDGIWDTVIIV